MNVFVAFFVLLSLLADSTPVDSKEMPYIGIHCHHGFTCNIPLTGELMLDRSMFVMTCVDRHLLCAEHGAHHAVHFPRYFRHQRLLAW